MKLLNMLIEELGNNLIRCFETLKRLIVVLRPPFAEPSIENIIKLVKFFTDNTDIDPHAYRTNRRVFGGMEIHISSDKSLLSAAPNDSSHYCQRRAHFQSSKNCQNTTSKHDGR